MEEPQGSQHAVLTVDAQPPAAAPAAPALSGLEAYFAAEEEEHRRQWEETNPALKALVVAGNKAEQLPGQFVDKVNALPGMNTVKAGLDKTKEGLLTGVEAVGKGVGKVGEKGLEVGKKGVAAMATGVNVVTNQVGLVADRVLPKDLVDAIEITREVAMERIAVAGKAVEDLLKDPTWREFHKKPGFRIWNYYRVQLFYVIMATLFTGGLILMHDPNPPDNLVDAIFMTVSAMSGAGLTTVPMSGMSEYSMLITYFLMLGGGIAFLLLPPILWRLYQYRRFKPMVQKVIRLRKEIRADGGENLEAMGDMLQDFELQDEGLKVLALVIILYNMFFIFIGTFIMYGVIMSYGRVQVLDEVGINHLWFSTFTAVSSFNNVGFSLLDDNYMHLSDRPGVLILMTMFILCGNTGLPIMLRCIFTVLARLRPNSRSIRFVLDNPRRCTVAFFEGKQTAALFLVLCFNLTLQFVFFLGTSLNKPEIRALAPTRQLVVMGWFQSVSTRAAGMNVFDLRTLSKACAVIYATMMYVSAAPMVSMMQATAQTVVAKYVNGEVLLVYEEGDGDDTHPFKKYLTSHIRWLGLFFLMIATAEEKVLSTMPPVNLFDVLFEILSGYGTSGLSMGAPGVPYSLCGEFTAFSKIILIIVKLMGKHRGLPASSDAALDGQYIRIHSMLTHLEGMARHRMGKGDAPEAPDWVKKQGAEKKGQKDGLLANADYSNYELDAVETTYAEANGNGHADVAQREFIVK